MKNLVYFLVSVLVLSCNNQTKVEIKKAIDNQNAELDLIITHPKVNQREIPKTWKSLKSIQKDWIKVEKDKDGYLIYQPCDGKTETVKLDGNLTINWKLEDSQVFELEKFTRLTGNDAFRADCYSVKDKVGFELKAKIIDYKKGIVLWEIKDIKWLMTPKENSNSFRIIKNNCVTEKKKELDFLPIESN